MAKKKKKKGTKEEKPEEETPEGEEDKPEEETPETPEEETPTGEDRPGAGEEKINLTSKQLNARLKRAGKTERKEFLASLGFKSEAELQASLKAGGEAVEALKTDEEKTADKLAELEASNLEKDAALKQRDQDLAFEKMRNKALGLMAGTFHDPNAAFILMDVSEVDLEDGYSGLDDAILDLAKAHPWTVVEDKPGKKPASKVPGLDPANPTGEVTDDKPTDDELREKLFGSKSGREFFEPKEGGVTIAGTPPPAE